MRYPSWDAFYDIQALDLSTLVRPRACDRTLPLRTAQRDTLDWHARGMRFAKELDETWISP